MQFFTPELYVRFNSPDDEVADAAYQEWEQATEQYARHLETFRARASSQIQKLTELSLHDAFIVSRAEQIQAGGPHFFRDFPYPLPVAIWSALAIVTVKDGDTIRSLIFCLWDHVRTHHHADGWRFSTECEHWLYDEVESVHPDRGGSYLHRILLSSGVELEIPFTALFIHEFALTKVGEAVAK